MRLVTCHPGRVHMAKGLCASCYNRSRYNKLQQKEYNKAYRIKNKAALDLYDANRRVTRRDFMEQCRRKHTLKKYGITIAQYAAMLDMQGGVCAICGVTPKKRRLAVDHNHKTKQVRGLLCTQCNRGLGWFRDAEAHLLKAAAYIRKSNISASHTP